MIFREVLLFVLHFLPPPQLITEPAKQKKVHMTARHRGSVWASFHYKTG